MKKKKIKASREADMGMPKVKGRKKKFKSRNLKKSLSKGLNYFLTLFKKNKKFSKKKRTGRLLDLLKGKKYPQKKPTLRCMKRGHSFSSLIKKRLRRSFTNNRRKSIIFSFIKAPGSRRSIKPIDTEMVKVRPTTTTR